MLEYIAYSVEPIERVKCVDERCDTIYDGLTKEQQAFVEFVSNKHILIGVSELALDKLPTLIQMKYGTAGDAVKAFGSPALIKQTFTKFQQSLYI